MTQVGHDDHLRTFRREAKNILRHCRIAKLGIAVDEHRFVIQITKGESVRERFDIQIAAGEGSFVRACDIIGAMLGHMCAQREGGRTRLEEDRDRELLFPIGNDRRVCLLEVGEDLPACRHRLDGNVDPADRDALSLR